MTYNVTYLMLDAIYQVQTFAMLFSSGDLNECEVGFSVLPGRDMTPWPGVGQSVAIRPVNGLDSYGLTLPCQSLAKGSSLGQHTAPI